jgi:hypothetical protein
VISSAGASAAGNEPGGSSSGSVGRMQAQAVGAAAPSPAGPADKEHPVCSSTPLSSMTQVHSGTANSQLSAAEAGISGKTSSDDKQAPATTPQRLVPLLYRWGAGKHSSSVGPLELDKQGNSGMPQLHPTALGMWLHALCRCQPWLCGALCECTSDTQPGSTHTPPGCAVHGAPKVVLRHVAVAGVAPLSLWCQSTVPKLSVPCLAQSGAACWHLCQHTGAQPIKLGICTQTCQACDWPPWAAGAAAAAAGAKLCREPF